MKKKKNKIMLDNLKWAPTLILYFLGVTLINNYHKKGTSTFCSFYIPVSIFFQKKD